MTETIAPPANITIHDGNRKTLLAFRGVRDIAAPSNAIPTPPVSMWVGGGFRLLASIDPTHHGTLLHVSISHRSRYPTWEEIKSVRDQIFRSDQDVMMVLPQASDYVNFHPNCFHLWETPVEWGIQ